MMYSISENINKKSEKKLKKMQFFLIFFVNSVDTFFN